jgi:cytochrome P450
MKAEAVRLTTRIITIMAFGFDLQSLANNKEEQELCAYFLSPEFLHDMRLIFNLGYIVGTFPLPRTFFWPLIHGRTEQLTRDANQRFTGHILKLIEFKKKSYQKQQSQTLSSNSMMDSLLNKEGVQLTNDELIANAKAFYMGGLETTSTALMWTMYYLSLHPDIQEKCYEEVKEKFFPLLTGTNPVADEGNYWFEIISRLFYCQAIVKEGLRIAPPASFTSLQTENEETITLANGITFTGNDLIFVNNEGVHHSTDYYGPKAREFIPERWLTNDMKEKQRLEEYFFPFGGGPRHCPGNNLALHELILAIAYLCYHFKFSLNCPREEIIRMKSITSTANKMPLLFIPRNHSN